MTKIYLHSINEAERQVTMCAYERARENLHSDSRLK
jgi:hypothetical protein